VTKNFQPEGNSCSIERKFLASIDNLPENAINVIFANKSSAKWKTFVFIFDQNINKSKKLNLAADFARKSSVINVALTDT
jgi:hypothetical protein